MTPRKTQRQETNVAGAPSAGISNQIVIFCQSRGEKMSGAVGKSAIRIISNASVRSLRFCSESHSDHSGSAETRTGEKCETLLSNDTIERQFYERIIYEHWIRGRGRRRRREGKCSESYLKIRGRRQTKWQCCGSFRMSYSENRARQFVRIGAWRIRAQSIPLSKWNLSFHFRLTYARQNAFFTHSNSELRARTDEKTRALMIRRSLLFVMCINGMKSDKMLAPSLWRRRQASHSGETERERTCRTGESWKHKHLFVVWRYQVLITASRATVCAFFSRSKARKHSDEFDSDCGSSSRPRPYLQSALSASFAEDCRDAEARSQRTEANRKSFLFGFADHKS